MPLRHRLLAAICLALLISFSLSAGLAALQAAQGVRAEVTAALALAAQSTQAALADAQPGPAGEPAVRRLVAAFDGSRHVRAVLLAQDGTVRASSHLAPGPKPPWWFRRLVTPALAPVLTPIHAIPTLAAVRLEAEAGNEAAERWAELRARVAGFAIFATLAAALCSLTVARFLQPLTLLTQGLTRVGRGELQAALNPEGPPEIATLAEAFNVMAASLRQAQAQNRRLSEQLLAIAEEERAQIARDLHDEIGPLLFAITAFTATIGRMVAAGTLAPVPAQLAAIQDATARVQLQVRDMLGRLHPGEAPPPDLPAALADLQGFWRGVHPEITITLALPPNAAALPPPLRECLYRAAQEAITNAVRHAHPTRIALSLQLEADQAVLDVRDNGTPPTTPPGEGLGLPGMRARAALLGGQVHIARTAGWHLRVTLPLPAPPAALATSRPEAA